MSIPVDPTTKRTPTKAVNSPAEICLWAFISASWYLQLGAAQFLLEAGADINQRDKRGATALVNAAYGNFGRLGLGCDHVDAIAFFLARGVDPNLATKHGFTAVMAAARSGSARALAMILEAGGRIDAVDADGDTARSLAHSRNRPECQECVELIDAFELRASLATCAPIRQATSPSQSMRL